MRNTFGGNEQLFDVGSEMHKKFQSRPSSPLANLISVHKTCINKLQNGTFSTFENERQARSQIIAYEPRNPREAQERLSYLFAIVATAHDWLDDGKIEDLLTMIRNY